MLQISQTENPICSATIDQMRLRLAMNLPLDSQNFSSSGFQSEIHVDMLIALSFVLSCSSRSIGRSRGQQKTPCLEGRDIAFPPEQRRCCWPVIGPGTLAVAGVYRFHSIQASCQRAM